MKKLFLLTIGIILVQMALLKPAIAQTYLMDNTPVTTCSGVFYDNGGQNGTYSSNQNVTKTFSGTGGQRIRFAFSFLSTEVCCDLLYIYDGPDINAPLLGTYAGTNNPGVITSSGNTLTFRFISDGSASASGWAASVSCAGPVLTSYLMVPGNVNACSGLFYDSGGLSGNYAANENVTKTFCSDNGQKIQFNFTNNSINLNSGDTLFVFDGNSVAAPLLAAYISNSFVEPITSSGTCLTFRFKSDLQFEGTGWSGEFSCTTVTPTNNTFTMSPGIKGACSGIFTDNGGLNGNYTSNQFVVQTFRSTNGERLRFSFQQFNTESCCDFLEIYDGANTSAPLIGSYSGSNTPGIVTSSSNFLTFYFYTNSNTTSSGFAATIECAGTVLPVYNMNTGTTTACSGVFYDAGGSTNPYNILENRTQTFCSGSASKIQFSFNNADFNLLDGDTLFAYDGTSTSAPLLGAFVTNSIVERLTSSGTCITFRFKSDIQNQGRGWQAFFTCVTGNVAANEYKMSTGIRGVCNGTFTDDGGLASTYSSSQFRTQTFQSLSGERLSFNFQQFSTESCCDYLEIYDGPNVNAPFLGEFRGSIGPGTITSTGNSLTFRFVANGNTNFNGFSAVISCAGPVLQAYNMGTGTINTCSGVFYDAGGSQNDYPNAENRIQTFCSGNTSKIQFNFNNNAFDLNSGDTLFAIDGNGTSGPLLGAYTVGSTVETITSSGTCITFRFKSAFGPNTNHGWQAQISCISTVPAANVYKISSGIRGVCSGIFTDDGGTNANYNSSQFRTQTFQSLNGERLRFTFQQFSTETCCDFLDIYDGSSTSAPLIGRFSGSSSPGTIVSSGNRITFRFSTNSNTNFQGFQATIDCFGQALPVYNMSSGNVTTCAGSFFDAGGSSNAYPAFENRTQTFCADNGQKIQFTFNNLAFSLQGGDTLWAYDGNSTNATLLGIYVNNSFVETMTSSGTCLTFRFKSGASNQLEGWAAAISCTTAAPVNLVYPLSSGVRVACSGIFTDDGGLNGIYTPAGFKEQTFQSPTGERLRFVFQSFNTETNVDVLEIYDGPNSSFPRIARLSGTYQSGLTYTSTGGSLTFRWATDVSDNFSGWAASIQCAGPALTVFNMSSGTTNTCEGVFYDNGGGGALYPNNENRTQTFCSDNGEKIVFDFTNFDVQFSGDSLWAYDGNSTNASLIGMYVGNTLPEKITSSGTCITFRFKSDGTSTSNGWKAIISCTSQNPATVVYPMAQGIRGVCSGIFADNGGITASYTGGQNVIQTFQSTGNQRLRFNFQQFSLETNVDVLNIYDGPDINSPLIGSFTGTISPGIIVSSHNSLTFWFYNDLSDQGDFAATIECFDQALTPYVMSGGTVSACSGVFYDAGGNNKNYPIAENRIQTFCSDNGQKLQFTFNNKAFSLFDDSLWVYDGNSTSSPLIGIYVNGSFVEPITSTGTCVTFRFKSDFNTSTVGSGWSAQFKCTSLSPGTMTYLMSSGLRVVCNAVFTDDGGPNANYTRNGVRFQTFQSPDNSRLKLDFTQFVLAGNDFIQIYDGPTTQYPYLGGFSGTNDPGTIISTGNSLTIGFYTNTSSTTTGWIANFSCVGPAATAFNMTNSTITACEGRWFDSGGPVDGYQNNQNLVQTFCSGNGQRLVFKFNPFSNIQSNDTLWAYDGNSVSSPLLAALTGVGQIENLVSSGTCITFRFKSDNTSPSSGWASSFSCLEAPPQPEVFTIRNGVRYGCSGLFTDEGGPTGTYSSNQFVDYVFYSNTPGSKLQFNFTQFSTEANNDRLTIYDGPNVNSPMIGIYTGSSSPGLISSTGNALTFRWVSNSPFNLQGWVASIACIASVPLVGTLSQSTYCAGTSISIPFTSPVQTSGNIFTAQLSDANGLFTNPTTIGSLTATSAGVIAANLPSNLVAGSNYRIRVMGSTPVLAGNPSAPFSVSTSPAQPGNISGLASVCAGATGVKYSISTIPNVNSYTWTLPNGASLVSGQGENEIVVNWGTASGNVLVTATNACGTSQARNMAITVNTSQTPLATISSNANNGQVCQGGSVTFSSNLTAGTNPALQWLLNGQEIPGSNGSQLTLSNVQNNINVSLRVTTTSGCFSPTTVVTSQQSVNVISTKTVQAVISNNVNGGSVCAGQNVQFSANITNGGTTPQYSWRINGNAVSGNNTNNFTSSTLQNGDQVTLQVSSNAACASPIPAISNAISMVVNPVLVPTAGISSNTGGNQVCAGNQLILTANVTNEGSNPQYQWFQNGNAIPGETQATYTTVSGLTGTQNFTVRLTSNAICATPVNVTSTAFTVTGVTSVQPAVSITSNLPTGPVCLGTTITFTANPTNGGTNPSYQWRVNGNAVANQTNATFTTSTLANNDQVSVVLTSKDPCASPLTATSPAITMNLVSSLTASVSVSSSAAGNTICQGDAITFTANPTNGGSNPQFQWTVNGTDVNGQTGTTFSPSNLANNSQVRVRMVSAFSCANPGTITSAPVSVTVNALVSPTVSISSSQGNSVCQGSSTTLTANITNGGSNPAFVWFLNANVVSGQTGNTLVTPTNLSGQATYSVQLTSNAACASPTQVNAQNFTLNITPTVSPSVTVGSNVAGNTICNGQSITFTATPVNGGSNPQYQWLINGNEVTGQTNATFTSSTLANNQNVSVRMTSNANCPNPAQVTSAAIQISVTPNAPASVSITSTITGNSICPGQAVTFTANPVNGGGNPTYIWVLNGNDLVNQTGATYQTSTLANNDQVSVKMVSNSTCANPKNATSAAVAISVSPSVNPSVSINNLSNGTSFCPGSEVQLLAVPQNGGNAPVYQWRINGNLVPNASGPAFSFSLNAQSSVNVTLLSNANCANPSSVVSSNLDITVIAPPVVVAQADTSVCESTGAFTLRASPAGGVWSGTNTSSSGTFTPGNPGVYKAFYSFTTSGTGCTGTDSVSITVLNRPSITFPVQQPLCATAPSRQLSASPAGGVWTGTGVSQSGLFNPATTGPGQQVVSYTVTQNNCQSTRVLVINVTAPPTIDVGGNETVCFSTDQVQLSGIPSGGSWSGNGVNASGVFTPGFVGPGDQVILTYTVTLNGCTASKTKLISVSLNPVTVNAGADQTVCVSDPAFVLTGVNGAGGTWSGTGVSASGVFNPSTAGIGTFNLTYTVTINQSPGCSGSDSKTVTVIGAPNAPLVQGDTVCRQGAATLSITGPPAQARWYTTQTGGSAISGQTSGTFITPVLTTSTTYYASQVTGSCESPRVPVLAFVNAFNNATFTPAGTPPTLSANPANAQLYTWLLNGNAISGANQSTFSPTVSGDYSVIVSLDGCADTSAAQFIVVTDNQALQTLEPWKVFPTPAQNDLFLEGNGISSAELFDLMGRSILVENMANSEKKSIQIKNLPSGMYWIELKGNNRTEKQRVLIRH